MQKVSSIDSKLWKASKQVIVRAFFFYFYFFSCDSVFVAVVAVCHSYQITVRQDIRALLVVCSFINVLYIIGDERAKC